MIDYKKLADGNWVEINGQYYTVNGEFLAQIEKKNCTWAKGVKEIPLTVKLLEEACGFVNTDAEHCDVVEKDHVSIEFIPDGTINARLSYDKGFLCSLLMREVKYLHDLQNLFAFGLGYELEIDRDKLHALIESKTQ